MTEPSPADQSEISFDELIVALRDDANPFPARYLYRLSDLEGEELGLIKRIWPQLSFQRRLGVLEDLELLAESNTVMHFDAVNRIALDDEKPELRIVAMRALWPSEQPNLVPTFLDILNNDEDDEVRAQAAAALGRFVYLGEIGRLPAAELKDIETELVRIMASESASVIRRNALESLGYSGREEVVGLIEDAFESDDDDWLISALFAMGRSADDRWAPNVLENLSNTNSEISAEAARAAGELELEDAVPDLIKLLEDEESEVRAASAWALSQVGGHGAADALRDRLDRAEEQDEIDLLEDALENLAFNEEIDQLNMLEYSPEDLENLAHPNGNEKGEDATKGLAED
jgi:hypothetical protein